MRATPVVPLFGLAPGGVYHAANVTINAVRSYRTISPLPRYLKQRGGIFSVALAVGSLPPGVTWHPAHWSPDFPLPGKNQAAIVSVNSGGIIGENGGKS